MPGLADVMPKRECLKKWWRWFEWVFEHEILDDISLPKKLSGSL